MHNASLRALLLGVHNETLSSVLSMEKEKEEQLNAQLKREFGRMLSDATARVTGKVLTPDDQGRINQETAAQVSL